MRYGKAILSLIAAAFLVLPAAAAHYSDFYVIPVAGHVPGVNDTFFRSDVAIYNFQETPIVVEMALVESGLGISNNVGPIGDPITVPPNGSVLVDDVLSDYQGMSSVIGSILIGADKPFAVVSRAFTNAEDGGTYGQSIPAVRDFVDNLAGDTINSMASAWIPGAHSDSDFRTNVGFVAGANDLSPANMTIEVQMYDQSGGSLGIETFDILPGTINHTQFSTSAITGQTFTTAGVDFTITAGDGVLIPYISVVDNVTGDGWFVLGNMPDNQQPGKQSLVSQFREAFDRVTSRR